MTTRLNFVEQTPQAYYMDVAVFVCGVDVSEYVMGAVRFSIADRDNWNTASFQLASPIQKWVITANNLKGLWNDGSGMYDETFKKKIYDYKKNNPRNKADPTTGEKVYPLREGDIIFNQMDTVRIFITNPLMPGNSWIPAFSGYIEEAGRNETNYLNGDSTLTINCSDIRKLMQNMRMQMNHQFGSQINEVKIFDPDSLFKDWYNDSSITTNPLANLPFESIVERLVAGSDKGKPLSSNNMKGVGSIKIGNLGGQLGRMKVEDGWKTIYKENDSLEDWYRLLLFGETLQPLSDEEMRSRGKDSFAEGSFSPNSAKLYILLPDKSNVGGKNLVEYNIIQGVSDSVNWSSRHNAILEACKVIDYHWIVTGNGDIVFEFPQFDFLPSDYGEFRSVLEVDHHLISDTLTNESGELDTVVVVKGSYAQEYYKNATGSGTAGGEKYVHTAIICSPVLLHRLGARTKSITFPYSYNTQSLLALGLVEWQKGLSDFEKLEMQIGYRPFLLPNRPMYNAERKKIATLQTVNNSLTMNGAASTDIQLHYIRRQKEDGSFVFITGGKNMAATYRRNWFKTDPSDKGLLIYPPSLHAVNSTIEV